MTDYTKSTNFASKDALAPGNPLKIVKGTEIDTEFNNIATAVATKANTADIGVTIQGYDADLTTLGAGGAAARTFLGLAIGTDVQAFNSNLTTLAGKTAPSGALVGTTDTQTLTNKTIQGGAISSGTAVASTSGTSIDFTGIPSWVKRITVMFNGVSLSGTAIKYIQLGTGGVPTTTGYSGVGGTFYSSSVAGASAFTSAFVVNDNTSAASDSGHAVFTNVSGNIWVGSITMCQANAAPVQIFVSAGTVTLAGALNMVRITGSNGTDTFDAGSINILYE